MLSGAANRNFSNSAQHITLMIHTKNLKNYTIKYIAPPLLTLEKIGVFWVFKNIQLAVKFRFCEKATKFEKISHFFF